MYCRPAVKSGKYTPSKLNIIIKKSFTREKFMDFKTLFTTFGMIFLAELGDKTQLATFAFSANSSSRMAVFLGSAGALVLTSFLGVLLGGVVHKLIPPQMIKIGAGVLFMVLGVWMTFFSSGK
jgi:Ca2+/H+ antiporter, TMEM165/GDT1 family